MSDLKRYYLLRKLIFESLVYDTEYIQKCMDAKMVWICRNQNWNNSVVEKAKLNRKLCIRKYVYCMKRVNSTSSPISVLIIWTHDISVKNSSQSELSQSDTVEDKILFSIITSNKKHSLPEVKILSVYDSNI